MADIRHACKMHFTFMEGNTTFMEEYSTFIEEHSKNRICACVIRAIQILNGYKKSDLMERARNSDSDSGTVEWAQEE